MARRLLHRRELRRESARLSPFRLAPADWTSGDIFWLLEMIALPQVEQVFFDKLAEGVFKGRTVKRYQEHQRPRVGSSNSTAAIP